MAVTTANKQKADTVAARRGGEKPEERWCQYSLQTGITFSVLGRIRVPPGMDADDAFPPFHEKHFGKKARAELQQTIVDGGILIAEASFEPRSFLAYRLDDPCYWHGREATLTYLGVYNFRRDC